MGEWANGRVGEWASGRKFKEDHRGQKRNLISTYKLSQLPNLYLRKSAFICGSFFCAPLR
jgi:hypothetical protein